MATSLTLARARSVATSAATSAIVPMRCTSSHPADPATRSFESHVFEKGGSRSSAFDRVETRLLRALVVVVVEGRLWLELEAIPTPEFWIGAEAPELFPPPGFAVIRT